MQEPERNVERGPTPALDAEQLGRGMGDRLGTAGQVDRPQPGREDRLVGVAEGRVGDPQRGAVAQPPGEPGWPLPLEPLLGAVGRSARGPRKFGHGVHVGRRGAVGTVDRDVAEIAQQSGRTIGSDTRCGQGGPFVDEVGGDPTRAEVLVGQQGLQECEVRGDAPHPELRQRTLGPAHRIEERATPTGDLDQQRVEVGRDLRPRETAPSVEPDAGAARLTVGDDAAGVGSEVVGRILGGDTALQREAAGRERALIDAEVGQVLASRDPELGLDEVDVGDFLGDGVLDLDAGVHLDEDVPSRRVDEELDRSGVDVADVIGEPLRVVGQCVAQGRIEAGGGGDLDHLLESPLHRAVTLEEVNDVALRVAEYLHLDVAHVGQGLFEEHGRVTEGTLGLPHGGFCCCCQALGLLDPAQTSPAAAGGRLDEEGEADLGAEGREVAVGVEWRGLAKDRQAGVLSGVARPLFVAGQLECGDRGTDEGDVRVGARLGEFRALGEEAVPGVDRVGPGVEGGGDDALRIEVGPHRVAGLTDLIGLVGLEPVEAVAILEGVDRHRLDAELVRGPEGTNGDLTAVGDEQLPHGEDSAPSGAGPP